MKLPELIDRAVKNRDARAAGFVADILRHKARMNYSEILAYVQKRHPELDPRDWESLLYESETS